MSDLVVGEKIIVRRTFTVQVGGDIYQEGEIVPITNKNIAELEDQRWRFELVPSEKKKVVEEKPVEKKIVEEEGPVVNRAIRDAKDRGRTKLVTK